jgi:hypothetical protein
MKFKIVSGIVFVVSVVTVFGVAADAQQTLSGQTIQAQANAAHSQQAQQAQTSDAPFARSDEAGNMTAVAPVTAKKIGYRLTGWKTVHIHDEAASAEQAATLEQLGCEIKKHSHGDHMDLNFRCAQWRALTLDDDAQVRQWKAWLAGNGFETLVINPPAESPLPKVKFRLTDWKTMHLHQAEQVASFTSTFKMLGCEVSTNSHGDHIDAKIRCQQWIEIELPTEDSAHNWQGWLTQSGFETQHEHVHAGGHGNIEGAQSVLGQAPNSTNSGLKNR